MSVARMTALALQPRAGVIGARSRAGLGSCAAVNLPAIVAVTVAVRDGSGDLRWTSARRLGNRVRRNAAARPYLASEGSPARYVQRQCSTKVQQPGRLTFDLHRPSLAC